jgi:ribonuclease G
MSETSHENILINFSPQETRVAITYQGVVQELHIERAASHELVGNIYLGRIVRILPGMQSAFVDVGLPRTAFLHAADIWGPRSTAAPPIERLLHEGQNIVVQVVKGPIGTKGARLSTQISIAGRLLVHLPQEKHVGISLRIDNEDERGSLRERVARLVSDGEPGGYIVRTMAEGCTDEELSNDLDYLRRLWRDIQARARTASAPALLYQELSLSLRVLRDFVNANTQSITIDSHENFQKLSAFAREYTPTALPLLQRHASEQSLFDLYGIEQEIEKALARRVDLKSGGYLIFDQTEAMTTIDVNTGGFVGVRNFDETVFKTNIEAACTIARQLRLRNLGGIIIIDFIDMGSPEHQSAVLDEFNRALAGDHTRLTVNGFTALGLVEMTRKRTRESLARILCEECPTCNGRGEIKTAHTVCYEILRELLRKARQITTCEFRVLASVAVVDILLDEEARGLATISDFIGKPISLKAEPSYTQEQYDIVLL